MPKNPQQTTLYKIVCIVLSIPYLPLSLTKYKAI